MGTALHVYEQLTEAGENTVRARILAEAFETLEERYPSLDSLATRTQLSEAELRLHKEIEKIRRETEGIRMEIKELDARISKEIKELELRIVNSMGQFKVETLKWVAGMMLLQTGVMIGVIVGGLRLLVS